MIFPFAGAKIFFESSVVNRLMARGEGSSAIQLSGEAV